MKIGLLADIHANSDALAVVVRQLNDLGIESIIVAGDTVGYYYNIILVRELLSQFSLIEVRGNHEDQILNENERDWREYESRFGSGLRRNKEALKLNGLNYINNLDHPLTFNLLGRKITIAHGSPWNINHYIYPDSDKLVWQDILRTDSDVVVLGHTHHQMIRKSNGRLIINPGSVGQNRSAKSVADWAILDLASLSVEFRSTPYSSESLLAQCEEFDPGLDVLTKHLSTEGK